MARDVDTFPREADGVAETVGEAGAGVRIPGESRCFRFSFDHGVYYHDRRVVYGETKEILSVAGG